MEVRELEGRVAVVTGASSGIGRAVAEALAGAGAAVFLGARRTDLLEAVAERVRERGGIARCRRTDVTHREDVEALVGMALADHGRVDVMVNNAGVMPLSRVEELRVEDWERMVDVNLKGVLYGIAAVLPGMLDRRAGHVVNIGSLAGRRPFPGGTVYSATKFAVRSITAGMQLELSASSGIRVTDVQPGVVSTELPEHIPGEELRERFESRWVDQRPLQPQDVARAVLFAVSAPPHVNVNEILIRPTDQST
ncbi:MAG: SDR family oxidoreductase [Gemmatimonadota bacterium]